MERGHFHRVTLPGRELKVTNDCWEENYYPFPGTSSLICCPVQSKVALKSYTHKRNKNGLSRLYLFVHTHEYIFTYMHVTIIIKEKEAVNLKA